MDVHFGDGLTFDRGRFALQRHGRDVPMRPKAIDVLAMLVANPGRVLSKDEILAEVWPDVTVGEDSLTQCIHEIRAALGDDNAPFLRTIRGRGYMLDTAVTAKENSGDGSVMRRKRWPLAWAAAALIAGILIVAAGAVFSPEQQSLPETEQVTVLPLLSTGETMLGQQIAYPSGEAVISAAMVTLKPGAVVGWHVNKDPTVVYTISGRVELEYADGSTYVMEAGSTFIEGIDKPHSSRALGPNPARLLVLTLGAAGRPSRQDAALPDPAPE